ncbi:hypothetical protein DRQ36_02290 [bacterium]|nr:MAG: hypothetical protein DRQ36_02290 [bacterium]
MNIDKLKKLARIGFQKAIMKASLKKDIKTGISRRPPQTVYWIQHTQCNLNCPMCNVPQTTMKQEREDWISTERMVEIVEEMASMGVPNFGVSGGEPLLDVERLFAVLEVASNKGLYTHFGTNGLLMTEDILRRYDNLGVGHISLSIDAIGDVHDKIRGRKGVWENGVVRTLDIFEKVKPRNINLKINSIISDENLEELPELVRFLADRGYVVFLQPFDPCAYDFLTKYKDSAIAHDKFPQWIPPGRLGLLSEVTNRILEIEREFPGTLLNDTRHLEAVKRYFSFDLLDNPAPCTVAFENLWIKPNGNVGYCNYGLVGNLKETSLSELWNCEKMIKTRKAMLKCKFVCLLGCMYSPSIYALFKKGLRTAKKLFK